MLKPIVSSMVGVGLGMICIGAALALNFVDNSSFEECDDTAEPAHWRWRGSDMGDVAPDEVFQWELEGHSGEKSVSIREEGWEKQGWWYTVLRGVRPRRWYIVSLWAKRDRPTGWLPELEVFGQRRVMNLYDAGSWEKFDWLLNSAEFEGDALLKLINCRKPFKVWFDDVLVEEFRVEAETEVKRGKVEWSWPETSSLIVFKVEASRSRSFDRDVRVLAQTLNNETTIPADMGEGVWYWRVEALHNGALLATSAPRKVRIKGGQERIPPPGQPEMELLPAAKPRSSGHISFDDELNLLVEGKAFFPIGIYTLPREKFSEAKRAGFNTVLTDDVEAACCAGLKAIVPRGFCQAAGSDPLGEANGLIIARYLWDEPDQDNTSPREVFRAYKEEKRIDAYHPTAIVVYRLENFWGYAPASDILMTDPYPVPHRPLSLVSESVRTARRAVHDQKPVWAVIQAFDWMDVSQEARRTGWARWPTYEEERCMAYLAVINGAKGILFHRYCGEKIHDPQNWLALKRVAAELKRLSPVILSRTFPLPVSVDVEAPSGSVGKEKAERIEHLAKGQAQRVYLIAANNWPGIRRVTFSFQRELLPAVKVLFEKRRISAEPRAFSDTFAPYDVHVYELRFR